MKRNRTAFLVVFLLFVFFIQCNNSTKQNGNEPYVIMLSLDGFRWDYPDMYETPNLDYIALNGVKAESLKPCFPTKTFPNHYSIATGLHPDHHGIVHNTFYDPEMEMQYRVSNREAVKNPDFYGGEPIWVTAEKQNVTAASYFWVGSEGPHSNIYPTYYKEYEHRFPFTQRIDSVIYWLQLPEDKRPHLITFYYHEPDGVGHDYGPESIATADTVHYLDSLVGVFLNKAKQLPIFEQLNIIVTSDHGMGPLSEDKEIYLDNYLDTTWVETIQGSNPIFNIKAKEGYIDSIYYALSDVEHMSVWKHGELPEYLHYGHNPRTLDLTVAADINWSLKISPKKSYASLGTHGYDPEYKEMHAIFFAMGPAFKAGYIHPTFQNIDIYPLIADILNLEPAEVDGSLENVSTMLREK